MLKQTGPASGGTHAPARPCAPAGGRRGGPAVLSVAFAFWITMTGATALTPLHPLYGDQFGVTPFTVAVVFAVYAVAVVGLLTFGRLSDQVGRGPALLAGTLLSASAAVVGVGLLVRQTGPRPTGAVVAALALGVIRTGREGRDSPSPHGTPH